MWVTTHFGHLSSSKYRKLIQAPFVGDERSAVLGGLPSSRDDVLVIDPVSRRV